MFKTMLNALLPVVAAAMGTFGVVVYLVAHGVLSGACMIPAPMSLRESGQAQQPILWEPVAENLKHATIYVNGERVSCFSYRPSVGADQVSCSFDH